MLSEVRVSHIGQIHSDQHLHRMVSSPLHCIIHPCHPRLCLCCAEKRRSRESRRLETLWSHCAEAHAAALRLLLRVSLEPATSSASRPRRCLPSVCHHARTTKPTDGTAKEPTIALQRRNTSQPTTSSQRTRHCTAPCSLATTATQIFILQQQIRRAHPIDSHRQRHPRIALGHRLDSSQAAAPRRPSPLASHRR